MSEPGFDLVLGFGLGGMPGLGGTPGLLKKFVSALEFVSTNLGLGVGRGFRSGLGGARGLGLGDFLASDFFEMFRSLSRSSSILKVKDGTIYGH